MPVPAPAMQRLRAHRQRQARHALQLGPAYDRSLDLVFANLHGGFVNANNLARREWHPLCQSAGIENATPYALRHTVASQLLEAGINPKTVAAFCPLARNS